MNGRKVSAGLVVAVPVVFLAAAVAILTIAGRTPSSGTTKTGITLSDFGRSDVSAYLGSRGRSLADVPPVDGEPMTEFVAQDLYAGVMDPDELLRKSRFVVRGRPISFSIPYWNSGDGGFWDPRLVRGARGEPVTNELYRTVTFAIDEVMAASRPEDAAALTIEFVVVGGRAKVEIPPEVASLDPEFLAAGSYVWTFPAETDLVLGKEYVLFLDYKPLGGLYDDFYGYEVKLRPTSTPYYAFSVDGDSLHNVLNEPDLKFPQFEIGLSDLRAMLNTDTLGAWAQTKFVPDGKVYLRQPSHGPSEEPEWDGPSPASEVTRSDVSTEP